MTSSQEIRAGYGKSHPRIVQWDGSSLSQKLLANLKQCESSPNCYHCTLSNPF